MSDDNDKDNTGKQKAVSPPESPPQTGVSAPEVSPPSVEQTQPTQRKPEFGDSVLYVDSRGDTEQILQASVQVAFADGTADLRVSDPGSQYGRFDVSHAEHDANEAAGTFHFKPE